MPELDARLLVCAACGIDHAALIRDPGRALGENAATLAAYARRRLDGEPVSRILGHREFWGLSLAIDGSVLDPRPDTETLVGAALEAIGGRRAAELTVVDFGTGSAAILCALLTELPQAFGIGIDRSAAACRVAAANVATCGLSARAAILCASWNDALASRFDLLVANPPYIPGRVIATLAPDVRDHDPRLALDGGLDGLDAYRALCPRLPALLRPGAVAAFECGWDQGDTVAGMMRRAGLSFVETRTDLSGRDRVVMGRASVA